MPIDDFTCLEMTTSHLLYLHGFLSSPASTKARKTAAAVAQCHPNVVWLCPMLAASPRQAMDEVLHAIAEWPRESMAIIGSSLGGFYANWLAERLACPAVLLNPAVRPARDLAAHVGEHTLWHDSDAHFVLEPRFIDEMKALEVPHISQPERYLAIIAKGDEVLDWREMHSHYAGAHIKLLPGSDHGLSDYDQHLDEVLGFLQLA
ncbi:MAG: esterase [Rhodoferax ferrireducens]|uniref:Esterase n=1 Tax=Rhodoferax ferrireducens TaxID=192843 RepID=A0A1W9KZ75_9BURK|nr:MAG: esterase [Rhodoferax ferrireducens]